MGLLAACLPPLKPLLKHISSPRKMHVSMKHGLSLKYPGRREAPRTPSSVDNVSEMASSKEGKTEPCKEVEIEMAEYRVDLEENGGLPEPCKVRHSKTGISDSTYRIATYFNIQCFHVWVGNWAENTKFSYIGEPMFRHGHRGG